MLRSYFFAAAAVLSLSVVDGAFAEDTIKIGFILPMTGQQQSTGKQEAAAIKLFTAQHGDMVAGKKIEVIIRDDAAVPDNTKRIAQELIVNDKVTFLAGFGVTPAALSVAPLSAESQDARDRDRRRHVDHHREVALHRAHQFHAGAIDGADG